MTLRTELRRTFVLPLEVFLADHSRFFDADPNGFLEVDMEITVECPGADERVRVVRGAADHRVEVQALVVKQLAPTLALWQRARLLGRQDRKRALEAFIFAATCIPEYQDL